MTDLSRLRLAALALTFMVAGCAAPSALPLPTDPPAPATRADTRPANASDDVVYLRSNSGTGGTILAIDARTGQTVRTFADGAVSADAGAVYSAEAAEGGAKTTIRLTDLRSGGELRRFTIDGDLRLTSEGSFYPLASGGRLSPDGRLLALMNSPVQIDGQWHTKLAIVDTATGSMVSLAEFRGTGTYGFVTFAPDGRWLFLEQYGDGPTRMRAYELASAKLVDLAGPGPVAGAYRTTAVLSPDARWMFRIDTGNPTTNCTSTDGPACTPNGRPPQVVALDLATRQTTEIALSAREGSHDFEKSMLWSLAITRDGSRLYAVNPALGLLDEIDARQMTLRRSAKIFRVAHADESILERLARFFFPVANAKRFITGGAVLSPDGRTLYAAAELGIWVIDPLGLTTRAVWQQADMFDTLRLSSDGKRLYAVSNMSRTLVMIDTATGEKLGEVKGLGYVPAIVRVDSR